MHFTDKLANYSQFISHLSSISESEMNIQISLCNVWHLDGILKISLKKTLTEKKSKHLKKIQLLFLKYLNAVICDENFKLFIPQ